MVKDKGLNCNLIISRLPAGAPVTERAIPVAIFSCEESVKKYFLRKWLKDSSLDCVDFRDVVDWQYYKERLGKSIQKIVTIPAGIQRVPNPCPRVEHPVWLARSIADKASGKRQLTMQASFLNASKQSGLSSSGSAVARKGVSFQSPERETGSAKKRALLPESAPEVSDLEDLAGGSGSLKGFPVAHNFRKSAVVQTGGDEEVVDVEAEEVRVAKVEEVAEQLAKVVLPMSAHKPQTREELDDWLESRKSHWRRLREERKARRGSGSAGGRVYGNAFRSGASSAQYSNTVGSSLSSKKAVGVLDYVRSAQRAVSQHCWQVLELRDSDVPGELRVWAFTTPGQLQSITVVVPRRLYVNVTGPDAQRAARELGGVEVKRDLPHSRPSCALFEIDMPEHKYQSSEKALALFLSDSQVEGVYESQVPLAHRAVLQMGCVTRCVNDRTQFASKLRLADMELVHVQSFPYLESGSAAFKRMFLYHALNGNNSGNLGVVALFLVDGSNAEDEARFAAGGHQFEAVHDMPVGAKAYVWLVNGRGAASLDSVPAMQRIYRKFQPVEATAVRFKTAFAATAADAFRMCNEKLTAYQRERHGPTLAVVQGGALDSRDWRYHVPMLHEYPVAVAPSIGNDDVFPAVGWQQFTCSRLVQRFLIFPSWFADRLHSARHALVPVCNLGPDALTTIIDVVYSRQLVHNRHLLWCSEGNNTPDIGDSANCVGSAGAELDDLGATDVLVSHSGVFRDVCIELDLYGLAVCSIMSSGELDAEGFTALNVSTGPEQKSGVGAPESDAEAAGADDHALKSGSSQPPAGTAVASSDASCARAFNILKALVAKCLEEVERRGDVISDAVLNSLYR